MQVVSASGIVFANKAVMTTFGFKFIYALTLIHTLCTLIGMQIFSCIVSSLRHDRGQNFSKSHQIADLSRRVLRVVEAM